MGNTLQLSDLIRLNDLKKADADMPQAILSPKVGGLDDLAGKLEDNRDVTVGVMTQVFGQLAKGMTGMEVDCFGEKLSLEEFETTGENAKICKDIMKEEIEIEEGSYECELSYLPISVARKLKEMDLDALGFENLRGLNIEALKQLSKGKIDHYHLFLPAAVLNPEKARFLAENWKSVSFHNVKGTSLEIMEELVQIENLSLDFEEMDLEVAKLLATHKGYLGLNSLRLLSLEMAAELGKHDGDLNLGLLEIDSQVATAIAGNNGYLFLRQLENLDAGSARGLAEHRGGELRLGMRELNSAEVAEELIKHQGQLVLENLSSSMPDEVAKVLATGNDVYAGGNGDYKLDKFRNK
jgi:hypothetical protein